MREEYYVTNICCAYLTNFFNCSKLKKSLIGQKIIKTFIFSVLSSKENCKKNGATINFPEALEITLSQK